MIEEPGDTHTAAKNKRGRQCPTHYRYAPSALAREPDLHADTLYVIGGLYGNVYALERILDLADSEAGGAILVFDGDFNWFNVDAESFSAINRAVMRHVALRGNVETEISGEDEYVGCGCAYPDEVSDTEVERSNEIIARLRQTARAFPAMRAKLGALPMHLVAEVAGIRAGIVHGDAESLAGWTYSEQALSREGGMQRLLRDLQASRARVIASTHTCLPVALGIDTAQGICALFNNGAAGMPNFRGTRYGLITRIATRPAPHALYGARIGTAYVEALAVHYDHARWMDAFLANWPEGSPAYASYFMRMTEGPSYDSAAAVRGSVSWSASRRPAAVAGRSRR